MNINDDNEEKGSSVLTDFIKKLTDLFFITIGEKAPTNIPLSTINRWTKSATLTRLYGPMYLELEYQPLYYDLKSIIFETRINRNLICSHGYTNCVTHTDFDYLGI